MYELTLITRHLNLPQDHQLSGVSLLKADPGEGGRHLLSELNAFLGLFSIRSKVLALEELEGTKPTQ